MTRDDETSMEDSDERIFLTLLNGTGYIFNVDDYLILRKDHRILGAMIGTTGTKGWSANECTMPVALTEHETRLLIEQSIAVLVSKSESLLKEPTLAELTKYKEHFESRILKQEVALKAEKIRIAERNLPKIMEGKKKKLIQAGLTEEEANELDAGQVLEAITENIIFERKNALLEITCAHPFPHVGKIRHLPPLVNSLKYRVFRDLWRREKYVTSGDAFGCDFLVYPGDPLLYHASHILIILDKPKLDPLSLIAKVRLSVNVNKYCVFAYEEVSPKNQEDGDDVGKPTIQYQTFKWDGSRERRDQRKDDHNDKVTHAADDKRE